MTLKNHNTGEEKILFLNSEQEKDKTHFMDKESGVELELERSAATFAFFAALSAASSSAARFRFMTIVVRGNRPPWFVGGLGRWRQAAGRRAPAVTHPTARGAPN